MKATEWTVAAGLALLLAIAATWPIAARFGSSGRLDSGDGRFSVWNVAWVAHALSTNPAGVYDTNIFYPHENTLAFSEANLLAGALAVPVWRLTRNPHAASNFTIIVSFALAALMAYVLVRRLTGSRSAGTFAGLTFAFCPFVYSHIPHVQLLMTFGLPLILLALHRFVEAATLSRALWLGAAMALEALACAYYGIFGGLMAGFGVVWFGFATTRWRDWRYWSLGLLAGATAIIIVAPFFLPYLTIQEEGFERTLADARVYSAGWRAYLASPILLHQWMLPLIGTWREVLFPGFLPVLYGLVGLLWLVRRAAPVGPRATRAVVGFYAALGGLALWASFGPDAGLYTVLHETVPVFSMLRAPSRFGILVVLALAVLGGIGLAWIRSWFGETARRRLTTTTLVAVIAGSSAGAIGVRDAPEPSMAERQLVNMPTKPLVQFPFYALGGERFRHTEYMLQSTLHWTPMINGYSDHMPPRFYADADALATFPSPDAWRVMQELGARYVLVHWRLYGETQRAPLRFQVNEQRAYLRLVYDGTDASLYEIVRFP